MSFRLRLSLLFVATLVAVQIFTALLVYAVARRALIAEGERQLTAGAGCGKLKTRSGITGSLAVSTPISVAKTFDPGSR